MYVASSGSEDAITPNQLRAIIDKKPSDLLLNNSPDLHVLAEFCMRYGLCTVTKDHVIKLVKSEQINAFVEDPQVEKMNHFLSFTDFLTKTDLGFAVFQIVNCHPDWEKKRGRLDKDIRYGCSTEFTSSRSNRRGGGHVTSEEGMKFFYKCVDFFGELKTDDNYGLFRSMCTAKAKAYGILPDVKKHNVTSCDGLYEDGGSDAEGEVDRPVAPVFNVGQQDLCEGIVAYPV